MTKTELKEWMWQWLSPYADQYKFMDEFDAKIDSLIKSKADELPISFVSVSDEWIKDRFPFDDENNASPTRPLERIRAYNQRQIDRRQGARTMIDENSSR